MTDISAAAAGKWRGILVQLGIDEKFLTKKNGPCPMCGGKDRWRFTDHNSNGCWVCNHCGKGDGFELLKLFHNWSYAQAAKEVEQIVGTIKPEPQVIKGNPGKRLARIRSELIRTHPEITRYLERRGVRQPPNLYAHPALGYYDGPKLVGKFPAMVAIIKNRDGATMSMHVTYLKGGKKADVPSPRKILTPVGKLDGSAIRLFPVVEQTHLGVAEGIETALSASRLAKIPVWSVLNTALMEKFAPPSTIKRVTIFADNDKNYAGMKAAYALAFRLSNEGLAVEVKVPAQVDTDFNDVLLERIREKRNGAAVAR